MNGDAQPSGCLAPKLSKLAARLRLPASASGFLSLSLARTQPDVLLLIRKIQTADQALEKQPMSTSLIQGWVMGHPWHQSAACCLSASFSLSQE